MKVEYENETRFRLYWFPFGSEGPEVCAVRDELGLSGCKISAVPLYSPLHPAVFTNPVEDALLSKGRIQLQIAVLYPRPSTTKHANRFKLFRIK